LLLPLIDPTIMATQSGVSWGLKGFPSGTVACNVPPGVDVEIAATNHPAMNSAITTMTPEGEGTPARQAIEAGVAYLKGRPGNATKYIVLATDGAPNCADNMTTNRGDGPGAVAAVATAAADGIGTFVVGVGTSRNELAILNMMAEAGKQARNDPVTKFYAVATKDELVTALGLITGQITNCVFPLNNTPPSPNDVAVNIDGMRIMRDPNHVDGWDYGAGMKSVQLYGAACEALKTAGAAKVDIIFGCPNVPIP
jgi:hypothetical protein